MTSDRETERQRWRVVAPFGLHWLVEGNEAIVYYDGSGDTHLLGRFAADVLRRLEERAVSATELTTEAVEASGESDIHLGPAIDEALREFRRLGLIEPSRA